MRWAASILLLGLALVWWPSLVAAEPGAGTIAGRVVNGTPGGGPVGDLEVTLQGANAGGEALQPRSSRTDAQGSFRFDDLPLEGDYAFMVFATYNEAEYYSDIIQFGADTPSAEVELRVYEPTTAADALRVTVDHVVLEADSEAQVLRVLEVVQVVNEGDRAYVGTAAGDGPPLTLLFSLPEGAVQVQPMQGLVPEDLVATPDGVADTAPVVPGQREVALAYDLPYTSSDLLFRKTLPYATDRFAFLLLDVGARLESPSLASLERVDMGGRQYLKLAADSLEAGTPVEVSLRGLPLAGSDGGGGGPDLLWPILGVGLAAALALAVLYPWLRRRGLFARPTSYEGWRPEGEDED